MSRWFFALVTVVILLLWADGWRATFGAWDTEGARLGVDFRLYVDAARQWAEGGEFYPARQLAGPYEILTIGEILYPPTAILLFLPFVVIPPVLWWAIPIAAVIGVIAYWRPAPYGWPLLALILWWPRTNQDLLTGNPAIWIAAFAALGTIWYWPAPLVLLKPTLAPAAVFGIRHRAWWIGFLGLALASLAFLPMWFDYAKVLLYARHAHGWLYSLAEFPMAFAGVAAWAASTRRREATADPVAITDEGLPT